jgi:hypothetical protein
MIRYKQTKHRLTKLLTLRRAFSRLGLPLRGHSAAPLQAHFRSPMLAKTSSTTNVRCKLFLGFSLSAAIHGGRNQVKSSMENSLCFGKKYDQNKINVLFSTNREINETIKESNYNVVESNEIQE